MRMPNQNLNATFVASTFQGIQASESKLRISAASNLQDRLRRIHPRNPGFGIQASNFGCIKPPSRLHSIHVHGIHASKSTLPISAASNLLLPTRRLCRIHVHGIQASDFDLFGSRCDRRTIAFLFYTFVGNDGRRASALTRRKVGARAFTRSARSHLACPLPQSN